MGLKDEYLILSEQNNSQISECGTGVGSVKIVSSHPAGEFKCRSCGHVGKYYEYEVTERGFAKCEVCGLYTQVKEW